MENSLFWDAQTDAEGVLDRVYNSDDFASLFYGFWDTGLIPNTSTALLVEPIENSFAVVVNAGDALIKGRFYQNTDDMQFTLANGNAETRVDFIALRFDYEARRVYLKYLQGADGQGEPSYARTPTLYDLLLAKITVPANAQYLTDEMVDDLRGTTDCPWVNLRFDLDAYTQSFQEWYTNVRQLLDEDAAIQLQEQIDTVKAQVSSLSTSVSEASESAAEALAAAQAAQGAAESAMSKASENAEDIADVSSVANTANTTANSALTTANTAKTTATNAQNRVNTAQNGKSSARFGSFTMVHYFRNINRVTITYAQLRSYGLSWATSKAATQTTAFAVTNGDLEASGENRGLRSWGLTNEGLKIYLSGNTTGNWRLNVSWIYSP